MKNNTKITLLLLSAILLFPEIASASGIAEFKGPVEKVLGTVAGPVGGIISAIALAISGITFIMKKAELGEGFKMFLSIIIGISFIAFASAIVNAVFTFTGAIL
ncbi:MULTISPECIES: TrbC/VirB2 family protein [unclassified Maridesulfovibrio]|uniref:TrbC/VirB2 family protein n=1 Tax=unclassified Maridesulfovibrio TaxID=2794999 RepID=UPI003B3D575A